MAVAVGSRVGIAGPPMGEVRAEGRPALSQSTQGRRRVGQEAEAGSISASDAGKYCSSCSRRATS